MQYIQKRWIGHMIGHKIDEIAGFDTAGFFLETSKKLYLS